MKKKNELELTPFGLRLALAAGASAFALSVGTAWAQDDQDDDVELIEESEEEASSDDEIVVTGSRIRRSTFNSISPLQVITADDALDVGLIDPAAILQQSEAAAGQQIDATFQGFVLDNGPGTQTVNIRGLGPSRSLILLNGRRLAPAGVEGAPINPSVNLIPGSLVDRSDILLDGASSVYGSDAVAGVVNVILKKDFDGFEFFAGGDYNQAGAGHDYTLSGAWGKNNDRGFIGIGVEYDHRDEVTFADRDYLAGCDTHYEITEDGDIRTSDIRTRIEVEGDSQGLITAPSSPCKTGGFSNRFFEQSNVLDFGSAYYTAGTGNILPNYTDTGIFGVPVDRDGDGVVDLYFPDFSFVDRDLEQSLISEQDRWSALAYGEYTFEGEMNITPFFEALAVTADGSADSGQGRTSAAVPANNPFNPCNPDAPGGVDCGLAQDAFLLDPNYIAAFQAYYANPNAPTFGSDVCFRFGLTTGPGGSCDPRSFGLIGGPVGAQPVLSQTLIEGNRNLTDVTLNQYRAVGGVRGDLPFLNVGSLSDWQFEASFTYSLSDSESSRLGIRDDRLALALGWDPTTDVDGDGEVDGDVSSAASPDGTGNLALLPGGVCDVDGVSNPDLLQDDAAEGCVPVNLFSPALFDTTNGQLTAAERDYLFDSRDFETEYQQTIFNAYLTGALAELPAGYLSAVIGVEYRVDDLTSTPDNVARDGLFTGFFRDLGAQGNKWTREAFGEIDVPLLGGKPLARELSVNASARWTEDQFYGSAWTYAVKGGWRPVDPLLLKASYGTSFRAPNLRENFILGTTGFLTVSDPCAVPAAAIEIQPGGGFAYNEQNDAREPNVLANCRREGRDPTSVGFDPVSGQGQTAAGVEISRGGTDEIGPETSESFTAGLAFEQPWFDSFDLNLNVNYYDIEITDSIIEPGTQFSVNDCFLRDDGQPRSTFCDRLSFDGAFGLISDLNASFENLDSETVAGLDYNIAFRKDFEVGDEPMTLRLNLRANQLKERSVTFIGDDLQPQQDNFEGTFGFPEWTGTGTAVLSVQDYRFTWSTRYIGEVSQRDEDVDAFSDAIDSQDTGFFGDTCGGPEFGDVLCRDVGFADDYMEHTASIAYVGDTMTIRAGVENVFATNPPRVDGNEVFSISNVPIGNTYDLDGREFFLIVSKDF